MQIHAFAAQHALVNRMVFVSFHAQLSLPVPVDNYTAAYAAIAAGATITARRKFIMLMIACHVILQMLQLCPDRLR